MSMEQILENRAKANEVKARPAARSLLYATGLDEEQINKPLIAVIYNPNQITPGHIHLDSIAMAMKIGIHEAGGVGILIPTGIGICDGIAMGHDGMKESLVSREANMNAAISHVLGHGVFEGVGYIQACDKNAPGLQMAAAYMKWLPQAFATAGAMKPGCAGGKPADVVTAFGAEVEHNLGQISDRQYEDVLLNCCPGAGSCSGLFTANSLACLAEALGIALPGMATAHATDTKKIRLATQTGRQIMKMIADGITMEDILTEDAFYNAFVVDMAIGASSNTVLHVPAVAEQAGYTFDLNRINEISYNTPNILRISPASDQHMSDFEMAGGVPVVMKRLRDKLKTKGVMTISGPLEERLDKTYDNGDTTVIKSPDKPYSLQGGLVIYHGNLAPEGAVIKESGIAEGVPDIFKGTAVVFDDEQSCTKYINAGKVKKGDVIIIRYEGPAGSPGMPEMLYPTSSISKQKADDDVTMDHYVALLTDGRFSGGTKGLSAGHVAPEAYNGGPIAFVQNGDQIIIDRNKKTIDLILGDDEWAKREAAWIRVEKPAPSPATAAYRQQFTKKMPGTAGLVPQR